MKNIILNILFTVFLFSCTGVPRFTSREQTGGEVSADTSAVRRNGTTEEKTEKPKTTRYGNYSALETVEGKASYYSEKFNGRPTASGEIFDMYEFTAAHRTYPLGTLAKITNLRNNKSIIVKINDRGPVPEDRIIDLSYGAAKMIDMINEGVAEVRIEILEWGK